MWFDPPSVHHLAQWLSIQVPHTYKPFERIWQNQISENDSDLAEYYRTHDKLQLLRQWMGIIKTPAKVKILGRYPLPIPKVLVNEFRNFWEYQFLRDRSKALDELAPNQQCGMEQIASLA